MDYFIPEVSDAEIRKQRAKAREMRHSSWWKRRLAEGRCYYCSKTFAVQDLTMDHIVPLVRGGRSTKGNCVPACKQCNNLKKHMLPTEWQEYMNIIGKSGELD